MKLAISFVLFVVLASSGSTTFAQLYSESFDDGLAMNRWTANAGVGFADTGGIFPKAIDTNFDRLPFPVDGVNDDFSGFAFDYSTVGIPSAPNSTGGTTTGLKLQADLFSDAMGGVSASPNGLNLTGDYSVKFDSWANTIGPFPIGGGGSTNFTTFGILTAGTFSQTNYSSDGLHFSYSGEGESSLDYRAHSVEDQDQSGYTVDSSPNVTFHAGVQNVPGSENGVPGIGVPLYNDAVGTGRTVPQAQIDLFAGISDQTGVINGGTAGFQWNEVEIRKVGKIVDWFVNGIKLVTVDITPFADQVGGGNISFGHTDFNNTSSTELGAMDLLFSLVDNIEVTALTAMDDADFDEDGDVDGKDFISWQRGFGINDGSAQLADGDATGDGNVNGDDLVVWQGQYGTPLSVNAAAVPEPTTWASLAVAAMLASVWFSPRRAFASHRA
ncbi:hypothetical protein [Bythopirellula goksoeyrii]|nr:hypothetical protein [Bythopirellula goksoeyrii]